MNEPERPMHPALIAVVVVLGIAFVGWALAGYVSELIGAYR
jgi:hypothetical protein